MTVATVGEATTLDEHQNTTGVTLETTSPIYETLLAYDDQFQPHPMLAESLTLSEDGLTWTFALRQGVPFHNGEMMTSADVKASMDRWGQLSGVGKRLYEPPAAWMRPTSTPSTGNLTQPYGILPIALSNNSQTARSIPSRSSTPAPWSRTKPLSAPARTSWSSARPMPISAWSVSTTTPRWKAARLAMAAPSTPMPI